MRLRRRRRPDYDDYCSGGLSTIADIEEAIMFYTQLREQLEKDSKEKSEKDKDKNKKKEAPKFNFLEVLGILGILYGAIAIGKLAMGYSPI
jgi:hypothetical protein